MGRQITIGTRGSQLALWQANWVKSALEEKFSDLSVELLIIKTKGDKILDVPLAKVGGKGLFVKEIEEALLDGRIDLAVHSMKDMPADIPEGLCIGAIPERENPRDALVSRHNLPLAELPRGARVGTSSLRRSAQLKSVRPDIEIVSLRGNLGTRLKKLETEDLDAIILAAAGLRRMGFEDRITECLDETVMLPAVGQGALCIESRENDPEIGPLMAALNHGETRTVVLGERAFLNRLEGGCQVPIACHGELSADGGFALTGLVASLDGMTVIRERLSGPAAECERIGVALAEQLLAQGAEEILESLKETDENNNR
ncbi:hydroxymethylbilane synthase [Desulfonema ishimotonii]|uniref:Porphobilinogen deaminase n=1 Tax=Desulfonema ishimotonii TaxID=45657 RepID=A0A401G1N9_9BACT|nr:hydroxymethylbilane synthase [Desulfonema ishimotonii]